MLVTEGIYAKCDDCGKEQKIIDGRGGMQMLPTTTYLERHMRGEGWAIRRYGYMACPDCKGRKRNV